MCRSNKVYVSRTMWLYLYLAITGTICGSSQSVYASIHVWITLSVIIHVRTKYGQPVMQEVLLSPDCFCMLMMELGVVTGQGNALSSILIPRIASHASVVAPFID